MRTRTIWTKIWDDDWFQSLTNDGQKLFYYLITNENIGFSGCYQISEWKVKGHTRIKDLEKVKTELYPKVRFYKDWVRVVNADRYNTFRGGKLDIACKREMDVISEEVKNALFSENSDRVSEEYIYPTDTSTHTHTLPSTKYSKIEDLKEEDFDTIATMYQVPVSFVKSKHEDMINWHDEDPKKNNKKNWLATLKNWVKRDSLKIKMEVNNGRKKIVVTDI